MANDVVLSRLEPADGRGRVAPRVQLEPRQGRQATSLAPRRSSSVSRRPDHHGTTTVDIVGAERFPARSTARTAEAKALVTEVPVTP